MQKVKISIHSNILIPADKKNLFLEVFFYNLTYKFAIEFGHDIESLFSQDNELGVRIVER